jgi:hypothetical protein
MSLGRDYSLPDGQSAKYDATAKRYQDTWEKYCRNVTVGQVATGLNEFFKDFRNRSILVADGINVVVRQVAGENVDALITFYRSQK